MTVNNRDLKLILATGLATSALLVVLNDLINRKNRSNTQSRAPTVTVNSPTLHSEELIREQLSRNYAFLGEDGMARIRDSFVVVVGLGGVGSWSSSMLVRSGVSRIRLIDFDQVTLSSLNRHATAQLKDVGTPKVESVKKYLEGVAPWCQIEACNELWNPGTDGDRLLSGEPDYVVGTFPTC